MSVCPCVRSNGSVSVCPFKWVRVPVSVQMGPCLCPFAVGLKKKYRRINADGANGRMNAPSDSHALSRPYYGNLFSVRKSSDLESKDVFFSFSFHGTLALSIAEKCEISMNIMNISTEWKQKCPLKCPK